MIGRPAMETLLADSGMLERRDSGWSSCAPDGADDSDEGVVAPHNLMDSSDLSSQGGGSTSRGGGGTGGGSRVVDVGDLFVPDARFDLATSSARPAMPDLPLSALPVGKRVWVVDAADVKVQLGDAWEEHVRPFCNGHACGQVVRHHPCGGLVVVAFAGEDGLRSCLTLPRRVLSAEEVPAYPFADDDGLSLNIGGLGPRAGRGAAKAKEEVCIMQQLFERVQAPPPADARLAEAWDSIRAGKLAAGVEALEPFTAKTTALPTRVDALARRSCARVFAGNAVGALEDALLAVDLDPAAHWPYVLAARAYASLGRMANGISMMNQAHLLLPHDTAVEHSLALLYALRRQMLHVERVSLGLCLDPRYERRLLARRGFQPGDVVLTDDVTIGALALSCLGRACGVCACPLLDGTAPTTTTADTPLDSRRCAHAAKHCLAIESGRGARALGFALGLLQQKAAASADVLSLDLARLALRVLFGAVDRWSSGPPPPGEEPTAEAALRACIPLPAPTCVLERKQKDDLDVLHGVATGGLSGDERAIFTADIFRHIFNYVLQYALRIEGTDGSGTPTLGYVLTPLASCVRRLPAEEANCAVCCGEPGHVVLRAVRPIASGEHLSIPLPPKGHV